MQGSEKFCFTDMKNDGAIPSKGRDADRIVINVGGHKHETHLSTLKNFPDTRLAWMATRLAKPCHSAQNEGPAEYFFDRHPGVFVHILNYYRTGKLHCPTDVCGPVFEEELNFWGIDELQMEPCCWSTYTRHRDAIAFEKVFTGKRTQQDDQSDDEQSYAGKKDRRFRCKSWRKSIWDSLEKPYSSKTAQMMALISLIVIITSVVTFCLETVPSLKIYKKTFQSLDYLYCTIFTTDFVLRVCSCPDLRGFFRSTLTWCDIASVIPFYTDMIYPVNYFNVILVVRLFRIFRLFRFFRFMSGMQVIGHTLRASARELILLVLILLIPMVIFSSVLYYAEQTFGGDDRFRSIPHTFWWAVITMTTVGYGDIVPLTDVGRVIGIMCACFGVLIVALPVSVIGSNFSLFYSHAQAQLKLPTKRNQPILVGAASALMSAVEPELSSSVASSSNRGDSHYGSESNLEETSKCLFSNDSENDVHAIVSESIELTSKSAPAKHNYLGSSCDSVREIPKRQPAIIAPFMNQGMNLGKGLKAMGDIMLNIGAPPQRRMALAGISTSHSPSLRRSNSGKKRTKSRSGDSLRKRAYTISSDYRASESNENLNDTTNLNVCDDHNTSSDDCKKQYGHTLAPQTSMTSPTDVDRSTTLPCLEEGNEERHKLRENSRHSLLDRVDKEENIKNDNNEMLYASNSSLEGRNSCILGTKLRDSIEYEKYSPPPPPHTNAHTEQERHVFPRYKKQSSAAINICNA